MEPTGRDRPVFLFICLKVTLSINFGHMKALIKELSEGALELLFPSVCLICGEAELNPGELVCPQCWRRIDGLKIPVCSGCGRFIDFGWKCSDCKGGHDFPVFALGQYAGILREIIHEFKFHGFGRLAETLGERILALHREKLLELAPEMVIPVPLHSLRRKKRGFNQAAILADIIGKGLGLKAGSEILQKIRKTKDQMRLDFSERNENIKDAFVIDDKDVDSIKAKKILLVDDVMTTGATLREAAKAIRLKGGLPVAAVTVGYTFTG